MLSLPHVMVAPNSSHPPNEAIDLFYRIRKRDKFSMAALWFALKVKSSWNNDRWTDITICPLHTEINVSPILPLMHPSSSICVMQLESSLVSGDTVSSVAEVANAMMLSQVAK